MDNKNLDQLQGSIEKNLQNSVTTQPNEQKIYEFLKKRPEGITSVGIINELGISRPIVEKQLAKLVYQNLADVKKYGGTFVYYPNGVFRFHPKYGSNTIAYRCKENNRNVWINLFKKNEGGSYIYLVETVKTANGYDKRGSILVPLKEVQSFAETLRLFAEGAEETE